ncbi:Transcription factor BTF3 [Thelohanellus kitauei]|uniref:Transcription factor BTF3 n=1 Tax=Thelohanellus kitauei TaxID=669202 RepID=A0A0C2J4F9_THEKT|nr:Transcription factor BTF3 [Thelohanellus kitauei]
MDPAKLKLKQECVRIGGKGTPRRKKKIVMKSSTNDDKKLQGSFKKLQLTNLTQADEIQVIKSDGTALIFKNPQASASYTSSLFTFNGRPETKSVKDIVFDLQKSLPEQLEKIKQHMAATGIDDASKSIPEDFEAISAET